MNTRRRTVETVAYASAKQDGIYDIGRKSTPNPQIERILTPLWGQAAIRGTQPSDHLS